LLSSSVFADVAALCELQDHAVCARSLDESRRDHVDADALRANFVCKALIVGIESTFRRSTRALCKFSGRRDYAILLLLARLGLRAGEVARLELDNIDWNVGSLRVQGKGGQHSGLPLPADVGAAITAYLQHGRPRSNSRRVFLRTKAPIRGLLGSQAIASLVRHNLVRADIQAPTYGAHQFRHALATEMLRRGASLAEIGEVLRHRSPETTNIYTKVDLDSLRALTLPWPGGVR
jgi:site-specific recombinase XerD